jgi:phosphoribosylanthranilate isomerase
MDGTPARPVTPPRTRVKICGLRSLEAAQVAAEAGADAIGLIFVPGTPRYIEPEQAHAIVCQLPAFLEPVGVFVDRPAQEIRRIARTVGLRTVQLHGDEPVEVLSELEGLRVIKAFSFRVDDVEARARPWLNAHPIPPAAVLFDAPPPPDVNPQTPATQTGGHGVRFDWDALARWWADQPEARRVPLALAGGLTAGNVGLAISKVRPWAVDVSSGVEAAKGVKDPQKIRAFCLAAQRADDGLTRA